MGCIRDEIDDKIRQEACCEDLFFSALDIGAAVKRLKPYKNDMHACLSSGHFINAGDDCFTHIAMMFNATVVHGSLPDTFLYSTILFLFLRVTALTFLIVLTIVVFY